MYICFVANSINVVYFENVSSYIYLENRLSAMSPNQIDRKHLSQTFYQNSTVLRPSLAVEHFYDNPIVRSLVTDIFGTKSKRFIECELKNVICKNVFYQQQEIRTDQQRRKNKTSISG